MLTQTVVYLWMFYLSKNLSSFFTHILYYLLIVYCVPLPDFWSREKNRKNAVKKLLINDEIILPTKDRSVTVELYFTVDNECVCANLSRYIKMTDNRRDFIVFFRRYIMFHL